MLQDSAILLDMLRAARLVVEFRANMGKATFLGDIKTQSAILHQLLVLGEAVKRLSEDLKVRYPKIPWKMIAGMRDKLIHEYDAVDIEEVWKTATTDVPQLITLLKPLLPQGEKA